MAAPSKQERRLRFPWRKGLPEDQRYGPAHPKVLVPLLVLAVLALRLNLGLAPSYLEEPRRAIVAMEMDYRGDWIVPTQLGEQYVNKPPLFNVVLILGSRILGGYSEVLGRLVSVLSLLGMGWLVYRMARPGLGADAAVAAAGFTVFGADIGFYFSTTGEIDLFYSLIHLGGFAALYFGDQPSASRQRRFWLAYLLPWLLCAAGTLTKGAPSPLFLGFTYLAWFGVQGRWRALFHPGMFAGAAVFFGIIGAYLAAYSAKAELGPYLEGLLGQSTQRTVSEHAATEVLRHLWAFPLDTLENLLPVSLLLPFLFFRPGGAVAEAWRPDRKRLLLFCWVVLAANVWVYWGSPGTRARYVYMLYPLLIVPLVAAWQRADRQVLPSVLQAWRQVLHGLVGVLEVLFPLAALGTLAFLGYSATGFEPTGMHPHTGLWGALWSAHLGLTGVPHPLVLLASGHDRHLLDAPTRPLDFAHAAVAGAEPFVF
jgi:4-amino-4-deoxy-L-arabinose transferase-like glycosyltransferase